MNRAFIIAMPSEADAIRPHLKHGDRLYLSGIGKVNAAAACEKAICEGAREIWNFGFAGGLDPTMKIGEICEIVSAVEYDFDLATLNGTRIGQLDERSSPYIPLATLDRTLSACRQLRQCILATGDRFNDCDDDMAVLRDIGATVRDMEGAAIAHVCEREGVRCHSVKCLTDVYGSGEMTKQYKENMKFCQEILSSFVKEFLQADEGTCAIPSNMR